jgi:fibronectin type 3 domain-containing protein
MKMIKKFCLVILPIFLLLLAGCSSTIPTNNAPIINSSPITSWLIDVLYTYNVEATDADGDNLTYSLTSSPIGMTIDSSTGVISWTASTAGDYNVTLKVSDGESFDTQSFTITVTMTEITTLSPPTGVEASDGDSPYYNSIQITWNTVSGATNYQVYRADSLTGTKTPITSWVGGTAWYDGSLTPGTTYYYWVKAATSGSGDNASDYSDYDTGWALEGPWLALSPPTDVSASSCRICSNTRITINWALVSGATHYQVYRANSSTGTKTVISNWQTATTYYDDSVTPETTYYYWVKAAASSSGYNASYYSDYHTGTATICGGDMPIPGDVEASNNYFDKVQITWYLTCSDAYFRVYRASSLAGTKTAISKWQTGTSYDDKSATPLITYYYWVKAALNSSGDYASNYSDYDTGKRLGF